MKATEDLKRALMDVFIHGGTKDHMSDIEIGDEDDPFEKTVDQRIPEKYASRIGDRIFYHLFSISLI